MRSSAGRASRWRRAGRLFAGRNELRRPSDRVEGAVLVSLAAAFITACVGAAFFAGHVYHSERVVAARERPAVAVLSRPGPAVSSRTAAVRARWRLPDGALRSGTLTTVTAPAIDGAPAGASVTVWLDRSGEPLAPPLSPGDIVVNALFTGIIIAAGAAVALIVCYVLCRAALDRHRLARWEKAWAAVGPRWTSRR